MKESVEFRVLERFASKLFGDDEGKRLGPGIPTNFVRGIELSTDDPRFERVGELQRQIKESTGGSFFYGWTIRRRYSMAELQRANLFKLKLTSTFEPAGEECGTKYDESTACHHCGAGATQTTSLVLDMKRIPKSKDVSRTIAGEIVVSRRVVELFARHGIAGAEFLPVRSNRSSSAESKEWFQLNVPETSAEIIAPTRVGIDPFDEDKKGECRCPIGDLIGLTLLSEASIKAATRGDADILSSRQFFGIRQGLLRPERIIFISPKVWRLIGSEKLRGLEVEVAHLI